jgi:hypothetical protein
VYIFLQDLSKRKHLSNTGVLQIFHTNRWYIENLSFESKWVILRQESTENNLRKIIREFGHNARSATSRSRLPAPMFDKIRVNKYSHFYEVSTHQVVIHSLQVFINKPGNLSIIPQNFTTTYFLFRLKSSTDTKALTKPLTDNTCRCKLLEITRFSKNRLIDLFVY